MNFDRLRFVAERAELGESARGDLRGDDSRSGRAASASSARCSATATSPSSTIGTPTRRSRTCSSASRSPTGSATAELLAAFRKHRIEAYDLSDNEMAKLHVRHLVGGHAPAAENEILYRFEFPERPGALMRFLDSMSAGWNISLFHYRNHGADYGRVLVGMQVPPSDKADFQRFLDRLGYTYVDESANPAYRMFLGR